MDFGNVMSFLQNLQAQNQQNQQNQFGRTLNQLGTQLDRNYGLSQNAQTYAKQQQDFMNQLALRKLNDEQLDRDIMQGQAFQDKWNKNNQQRNSAIAKELQNTHTKGAYSIVGQPDLSLYV